MISLTYNEPKKTEQNQSDLHFDVLDFFFAETFKFAIFECKLILFDRIGIAIYTKKIFIAEIEQYTKLMSIVWISI